MPDGLSRRRFLKGSLVASCGAAIPLSFEEQALLASETEEPKVASPRPSGRRLPTGRIGRLSISRLICGGNLISGFAHSRDLIYVSSLLKHYFTGAKVLDTFGLCEASGINTAILRVDDETLRLLKAHRKERGGHLQWIAQVKLPEQDATLEIRQAVDHGAVGAFVHGGVGDQLVAEGRLEPLGLAVAAIKKNGLIAGLAGHNLAVPASSEKAGLNPDFYLKTFNSKRYWSAGPKDGFDNIWEDDPQATIAFMQEMDKPWIAYKVLGAGAIHPREGFAYAFEHGADFLCVGMFDFQVEENVHLALAALERAEFRSRPWCG